MPSVLFCADEVKYCETPFSRVKLGFNKNAGALNMIHSPLDAALELVSDIAGLQITVDGKTCAIGGKVKATFADEALAMKFAEYLRGTPGTPMESTEEAQLEAAPSTPKRRPSKMGMDLTPPRCVRPRRTMLEEDEECKIAKA
mmetsp:Transcript_20612/g.34397  ORF Transcript_20612/g.34397 Transcript_20612/m.34397 type:complete len:143 (+) Transcript_20612:64-492(+)